MSKYEPLREHLARLEDVVWAAKLNEIERILGTNLPRSAREHRTWWANSGRSLVHQNAWLDAGWRVERTDLMRDVVVFRRLRIGGTSLAAKGGRVSHSVRNPQRAAEKHLAKNMTALRQPATVTLRSEWLVLGDLQQTPCSSSTIPTEGGVLRFASMDGDDIVTVMVATQSVQQVYRSVRMASKSEEGGDDLGFGQALFGDAGFNRSAPIECDVIKSGNAWLLTDGRGRKAKLSDQSECHLVARLLYLQELQSGRKSTLLLR